MADTRFLSTTGDTNLVAGVALCGPAFTLMLVIGDMFGMQNRSVMGDSAFGGSRSGSWKQTSTIMPGRRNAPRKDDLRFDQILEDRSHRLHCAADDAKVVWTKWVIPGYEYLRAECDHDGVFPEMIAYLQEQNLTLAGAVHNFTDPMTGKNYMCFPIRKL